MEGALDTVPSAVAVACDPEELSDQLREARAELDRVKEELVTAQGAVAAAAQPATADPNADDRAAELASSLAVATGAREEAARALEQLRASTTAELAQRARSHEMLTIAKGELEQQLGKKQIELEAALGRERQAAMNAAKHGEVAVRRPAPASAPSNGADVVLELGDPLGNAALGEHHQQSGKTVAGGAANLMRLLVGDARIGRARGMYVLLLHVALIYLLVSGSTAASAR